MALGAGVRNFVSVGRGGCDDFKSMGPDENAGDGGLDFGHVAGDALATGRALLVVSVFFERGGVWTVERHWAVAIET